MRRVPLKELRCVSCGEFLGYVSGQCTHGAYCSTACQQEKPLRRNEDRDSLVCELRASTDLTLDEIAELVGLPDKRAVHAIIQAF